jgi:hypothetical protein
MNKLSTELSDIGTDVKTLLDTIQKRLDEIDNQLKRF